ncbi:hypothetical protein BTN50_0497 [Candidatus Enterovibrio altilux]|uniref:Uncharacterized protein n=2 Tax=Candidatus Enterovibrio altilux TaxID=1927128 RepID=A0A291B7Q2_9GAMM|nr:hypothetical protein BTN50_0497 [Candidatus Enterovibrio luxaltus]
MKHKVMVRTAQFVLSEQLHSFHQEQEQLITKEVIRVI